MGLSLDELFGQVKDAVSQQVKQVEQVGVPAMQASLERWGAETLQKQANETQVKLNQTVQAMPKAPPGSLGASIQDTIKNAGAAQTAIPVIIVAGLILFLVMR